MVSPPPAWPPHSHKDIPASTATQISSCLIVLYDTDLCRFSNCRHLGSNTPRHLRDGPCDRPIVFWHILRQTREAWDRDKRLGMCCMCVSLGVVAGRQIYLSRGDILEAKNTPEHLKSCYWLVERYFMTGFVDAQEGEIAMLAYLAVFIARNLERGVACFCELG